MSIKDVNFKWSEQNLHDECEMIKCKDYDPYKDFKADESGHYCLIRVNFELIYIEVAVCNEKHAVLKVFQGKRAQDLYQTIFDYEEQHGVKWFTSKPHIAYLGKELKKAELALVLGNDSYYQE